MEFKTDENLPVEIARLLIAAGHDAKTVNDQGLQGAKDTAIAEVCRAERRVLVTLDTDFSDIRAYPPESHSGVIIIRVSRQSKPHIMEIFKRVLPLIGREPLDRHLWIVEENRVRIRGGTTG